MMVDAGGCRDDVCITCGDIAIALTVISVDGFTARCRDHDDRVETVAIELVGQVAPGDRVLVHAGVALVNLIDGSEGRDMEDER